MLPVFEAFTRTSLSVAVPAKMSGNDVLEALHPLILERGGLVYIRSDNGPECGAAPLSAWLIKVGIKPIRIYPRSPPENGYNERFNGRLRQEVVNVEWVYSTREVQIAINIWRRQYNQIRPHHALNMQPPAPEILLEKRQIYDLYNWGYTP